MGISSNSKILSTKLECLSSISEDSVFIYMLAFLSTTNHLGNKNLKDFGALKNMLKLGNKLNNLILLAIWFAPNKFWTYFSLTFHCWLLTHYSPVLLFYTP